MTKTGLGTASQNLTGLSILIAGKNTFGYTDEGTKVPTIEFETINEESTGIVKQPKMTLAIKNLNADYIAHIASGEPFVLKGNIREEHEDIPLKITAQGQLHKMEADVKEGDSTKRTFELRLDMYTEEVDGTATVEYSRQPYKIILGGKDMAPDFNKNI